MAFTFTLRQPGDTQNPVLARPYGRQMTRGRVVLYGKEGKRTKFFSLLATGGRYGCAGVDEVRYGGATLAEFDGQGNRQWKFRPGTRSTGYGDPVQGRLEFFPDLDFVFSGKCGIEVLLPEEMSAEDGEPQKLQVFMRGLLVPEITVDELGHLVEGNPGEFVDNASVSLDLLRDCGKLPLSRFDRWAEEWAAFRETCDATLLWDNGTGTVEVPRYDAHVVFSEDLSPASAFEAVMARAPGCMWQDVNGAIRVLTDPTRASVHLFKPSSVVRSSLSFTPPNPEDLPNFFIFTYRDVLDPLMKERQVVIDLPEVRDRSGGILNPVGPISLGVMTGSLAQRIARARVRVATENPYYRRVEARGMFDSLHVAKADYVDVAHPLLGSTEEAPLLARVAAERFSPKKGERGFTLQLWSRGYYSDDDHGPEQGTETEDVASPYAPPPVVAGVTFEPDSLTVPSGGAYGTVRGAVTFTEHAYAQRGRLWLKLDGAADFSVYGSGFIEPPAGSLTAPFEVAGVPAGEHELKIVTESSTGASLPPGDHPSFPFTATGASGFSGETVETTSIITETVTVSDNLDFDNEGAREASLRNIRGADERTAWL